MKTYYLLMKPGIIMGNLITTVSGFALASTGFFDLWLFVATMGGLGALIGSACVCNNYIDRHLDAKMTRTKRRPLVLGLITNQKALLFAAFLGLAGIGILYFYTNLLALFIALTGFFVYVLPYSLGKSRTPYATAIGSIAGAIPPVVGYCAASDRFDMGAALLFIILVLWQMPHFFSIALFRLRDYRAAAIPVMPVTHGAHAAKKRMFVYVVGFAIASLLLIPFGYTGYFYLTAALGSGIAWISLCLKGFKTDDDERWGRKMFHLSLWIITLLCLVISLDNTNPK